MKLVEIAVSARRRTPIEFRFNVRRGAAGQTEMLGFKADEGAVYPPEVYDPKQIAAQKGEDPRDGSRGLESDSREDVRLTAPDEQEFAAAAFRCRLPIVVTGERVRRSSNVVLIDGRQAAPTDAEFVLFLRLLVELWRTTDGYLAIGDGRKVGGLAAEHDIVPSGVGQAVARLRSRLEVALGEENPARLIERYQGRLRSQPIAASFE